MLDKLNVELDSLMQLKPEFNDFLYDGVCKDPKQYGFRQSEHYQAVGSLSSFGVDALFHGWYRHKNKSGPQTHKIEFIETGKMTLGSITEDLSRMLAVDPRELRVMRMDLCADFPGVEIGYFHQNLRFKYKQAGARFDGECYLEQYSSDGGETVYYGRQPNLYRAYNKTAERLKRYKAAMRRLPPDVDKPSFYDWCGLVESMTLSRLERQINGKRAVPERAATVGKLANLPEFNPFHNAQILSEQREFSAAIDGCSFKTKCTLLYLRQMVQTRGLDYTRMWIRQENPDNPGRALKELMALLAPTGDVGLSSADLYARYRESVSKQLLN